MKLVTRHLSLVTCALALFLFAPALHAQGPAKTTVTDTLFDPSGATITGSITITNAATFTSADGFVIPVGTRVSVSVVAGVFTVALVPNEGSNPSGSSYKVSYSAGGRLFSETWVVPSASPANLLAVRALTPPLPTVMLAFSQLNPPSGCLALEFVRRDTANTGWECAAVAGGSGHTIKEEGTALTARAGLNFVGPAITATDDAANDETDVTVVIDDSTVPNNITLDNLTQITTRNYSDLQGIPGSFTPSAHASTHQHLGSDEVATATPGANAIPKAVAGGTIAAGWVQEVLALADLTDLTGTSGTGSTAILSTITTPASNQYLGWTGTNWINRQVACGDLSDGAALCSAAAVSGGAGGTITDNTVDANDIDETGAFAFSSASNTFVGASYVGPLVRGTDGTAGGDLTVTAGDGTTGLGGALAIEAGTSTSGVQGTVQVVDSWNGTATLNGVVCSTGASSTVANCAAGAKTGIVGVALSTATPVRVVARGTSLVLSDNVAVVGDNFCMSTTTIASGHSNGTAICPPGTVLGVVRSVTDLTSLGQATTTLPLISLGVIAAGQAGSTGTRIVTTTPDAILESDNGGWVIYDTGSSAATIACPSATAFQSGWMAYVKSSFSGTVTITATGGCFIDTASLTTITLPIGFGAVIESDGTNFFTHRTFGAGTSGGIPFFSALDVVESSAELVANQIVLGGGAGTAPATLGSLGTTTTVLHGNAAGVPSFGSVVPGDMDLTQAYAFSSGSNSFVGASYTDASADPADAGVLRCGNNVACVAWELAVPGADKTLIVDASDILQFNGTLNATVLTESANAVPNATDHLGFFAATTSAQLRGVLSDENGTGAALFDSATNPTLLGAVINTTLEFTETAGDPTCAAGNYNIKGNSTSGKLRGCENGTLFDVNTAAGSASWSSLTAPTGAVTMDSDGVTELFHNNFTAAYGATDVLFQIEQLTGNPVAGSILLELRAADADILLLKAWNGTNGIQLTQAGALSVVGSGTITATDVNCTDCLNATDIDETVAYALSNTGNTFVGASYTDASADPADAGVLRCGNNVACVAWELAVPGADKTLIVDASNILQFNGTLNATVLTESANAVPNATDHLGFFAATTSAQLRGVLSDENGTGAALFDSATNPTLLGAVINTTLEFTETAGDPTCAAGNYNIKGNSTSGKLRGCENGTLFDLNTAGGGNSFGVIGAATADSGNDTITVTDSPTINFTTTNDPEDLTAIVIANSINATHIDETAAYTWTGSATTHVATSYTSAAADPADGGVLRGGNNENLVCAELAVAGADECLKLNASDQFEFSAPVVINGGGTDQIALGTGTNVSTWGHTSIAFEGATDNAFETTFSIADPTADRTVTIPNADSNTVQPLTCSGTDKVSAISSLGAVTCSVDQDSGGTPAWEALINTANTATLYTSDNVLELVDFNFTAAYGATDIGFQVSQLTGNPVAGSILMDVRAADADIVVFRAGDGTNGITVSQAGALTAEGTGTIIATDLNCTNCLNATDIDETAAYSFSSASNAFVGATFTSAAADPADSGVLRLGNAESICWESSPAGGDNCITVNSSEQFSFGANQLVSVTLNVEAGGNLITTVSQIYMDAAFCNEGTAFLDWEAPTGDAQTAPTEACNDTGAIQRPTASFAGGAVNGFERTFILPTDWASSAGVDIHIDYVTTAATPTGNVEWDISTVCRAVGESWDGTFNAIQTITDAVGSQNFINRATQTGVTITGCAAGDHLTIRVSRDGTNDTNNDAALMLGAMVILRRAQ